MAAALVVTLCWQVRWFSFEWFKHEALAGFDYVWRMDVDLWLKYPVGGVDGHACCERCAHMRC